MAIDGEGGAGAGGEGGSLGSASDLFGGASSAPAGEGGATAADGGQGGADPSLGADPDWWGGLSADADGETASHRDWVKSTGVKDLNGLVKVARDNQAALRDSGRVKVPGDGASAEEIASFHRAIGVPEAVDGYSLPEVKDARGDVIPLDQGLLGKLLPKALEVGVPAPAMNGLVAEYVRLQMDEAAQFDADLKSSAEAWVKAQGPQAKAKEVAINGAIRALGLYSNDLVAIRNAMAAASIDQGGTAADGVSRALDMFSRLGEGLAEDTIINPGGAGRFGVNGREAQGELDAMKVKAGSDPVFAKAVGTPGTPENARWNRLLNQSTAYAQQQQAAG
ncbi:hypothetical protein [Novosphingobium sp. RL4]|uniref:hypothetical protein n=1 Tax=Novosphingobium sp. RL4 TaxID=3109595 RepID=UPI002D79D13D|nr:hypothetical protein [Novosphingobium sp. RL4]WRT91357.1 hypothetical protein U9J33_08945 [Novosphingobium sp. RL4]